MLSRTKLHLAKINHIANAHRLGMRQEVLYARINLSLCVLLAFNFLVLNICGGPVWILSPIKPGYLCPVDGWFGTGNKVGCDGLR